MGGHIGLFESYKFKPYTYEIVLGSHSNSKTEIHRYGHTKASVVTPEILKCEESQQFWVSWSSGHIGVGHGEIPGITEIVGVDDNNFKSISYMGLSTSVTATGEWDIENIPGEKNHFCVTYVSLSFLSSCFMLLIN